MVGLERSRGKFTTNTGLEVFIQKLEVLVLWHHSAPHSCWIHPTPSTVPHHVLGILWPHGASVYDARYLATWSRVSLAVNDTSWTQSNYKTTWGLPRLQKQALIFFMTVISQFLSCDCSSRQKHQFLLQIACL